jgi:hypothetical protein
VGGFKLMIKDQQATHRDNEANKHDQPQMTLPT